MLLPENMYINTVLMCFLSVTEEGMSRGKAKLVLVYFRYSIGYDVICFIV